MSERKSSDLPSGISFPIQRNNLKQLTDLTQKVTFDAATEMGWFVDLGVVAGGSGWRVISDPSSYLSFVAFTAMVPTSDSACEPNGNSRVYAIDLGTGQSRLRNSTGDAVAFLSTLPGVVTDLRFYNVDGKARLLAGSDTGETKKYEGDWCLGGGLRRLNWREVPLTD